MPSAPTSKISDMLTFAPNGKQQYAESVRHLIGIQLKSCKVDQSKADEAMKRE